MSTTPPSNHVVCGTQNSAPFSSVSTYPITLLCSYHTYASHFISELGIQRIEAQHSIALSRHLGTPNIASKGKLNPRTVLVPLRLYPATHPLRTDPSAKSKASLIQEVDSQIDSTSSHESTQPKQPKGILKNSGNANSRIPSGGSGSERADINATVRPNFNWVKEGDRIRLNVYSPNVVRTCLFLSFQFHCPLSWGIYSRVYCLLHQHCAKS